MLGSPVRTHSYQHHGNGTGDIGNNRNEADATIAQAREAMNVAGEPENKSVCRRRQTEVYDRQQQDLPAQPEGCAPQIGARNGGMFVTFALERFRSEEHTSELQSRGLIS